MTNKQKKGKEINICKSLTRSNVFSTKSEEQPIMLISTDIHSDKFGRDNGHERYKQMKGSQNIQRLGHTKFTSCSSDFVLKTLERVSDLQMAKAI
jgi:hypothetical protein